MTIVLTDEQVQAIKAREERATYGQWDVDAARWGIVHHDKPLPIVYGNAHYGILADADAEFIAHARADIPALLTERDMLLEVVRAVATSNPYGSWLPLINTPAGVVCRWCMERAYTPAEVQHDVECTWLRARRLLGEE